MFQHIPTHQLKIDYGFIARVCLEVLSYISIKAFLYIYIILHSELYDTQKSYNNKPEMLITVYTAWASINCFGEQFSWTIFYQSCTILHNTHFFQALMNQ